MTERTDSAVNVTPESSPKRKWPIGWLIITVLLLIGWMITIFTGKAANRNLAKSYHEIERRQIEEKGRMLAASFRQSDPAILSEKGQRFAEGYFSEIMDDYDILFIIVLDNSGQVRATSETRFLDTTKKLPELGGKVISRLGKNDAYLEFLGPINNTEGKQIGAVLVGMNYFKDDEEK